MEVAIPGGNPTRGLASVEFGLQTAHAVPGSLSVLSQAGRDTQRSLPTAAGAMRQSTNRR